MSSPTARGNRRLPAALFSLAAGAVALVGGLNLCAYLVTHPPRKRLRSSPADLGLPYQDVSFAANDGITLSGWLIPADHARGVVIVAHGYPENREEMLPHASLLNAAGYTCLLFDFRRLGHSGGEVCGGGHLEIGDMIGVLDFVSEHEATAGLPIGALGHSLGAAVSIMAAARDSRLRAVVAEASYPDLQDALEARFRPLLGRFAPLLATPVQKRARRWVDVDARTVSPRQDASRLEHCALLVIQGKCDGLVRWRDGVSLEAAAAGPSELWLLDSGRHARCLADAPQEYSVRVLNFLDRYLVHPSE